MALIDRLKDATKPTNTIKAVQPQPDLGQRQEPRPLQATSAALNAPSSPPETLPRPAPAQAKTPAYATEPEAISRAYYVEDRGSERRYYDDYQRKALALRADDTSISTKRDDLTTIRAALALAEARGWSEVKVNGSAEFKRETWIEATARGITAQGYKASDLDRQEADRRRAERGPDQTRPIVPGDPNEIRRALPPSQQPAPVPSTPGVDANPAPARLVRADVGTTLQAKSETDTTQAPVRQAKLGDGPQVTPGAKTVQTQTVVPADAAKPVQQPTAVDHRKVAKDAAAALSDDGKLVYAALSEKIDRQVNKLSAESKAELKAFAATELVKKERAEGPVVLTKEQRQLATPEPGQRQSAAPQPAPVQVQVQIQERAPVVPERAPRPSPTEPEIERPSRRRSR